MSTQLSTIQPPRVSLLATMASKYNMEPEAFKATIKATVMPSNATNEQMAAFLLVANEYDLNPITKEIYAFPAKGGGVTPVVGIDGWINLAQRRSEFDGMEHEFAHDEKGNCISCTCRIWRNDRSRPVVVTEFMDECARQTDPWRSHKRRMLRHKATIQAIRYAFGFAGIKDEDDAEVIYHGSVIDADPPKVLDLNARLTAETTKAIQEQADPEWPQANPETGELVDSRGVPWIDGIHSSGKTCNSDGTWRRQKGISQESAAAREAEAMRAPEPEDHQTESGSNLTFDSVMRGIEMAETKDQIDEWLDVSRELDLYPEGRATLHKAATERLSLFNA